jgi:hypothetical protein
MTARATPLLVRPLAVHAERAGSETLRSAWLAAIQSWALPLWSLGVLAFSLRLVLGSKQVAMLRRRGAPADATVLESVAGLAKRMGLTRPVRVLIRDDFGTYSATAGGGAGARDRAHPAL